MSRWPQSVTWNVDDSKDAVLTRCRRLTAATGVLRVL